jgi:hypothetical protein
LGLNSLASRRELFRSLAALDSAPLVVCANELNREVTIFCREILAKVQCVSVERKLTQAFDYVVVR